MTEKTCLKIIMLLAAKALVCFLLGWWMLGFITALVAALFTSWWLQTWPRY